MDPAPVPKSVLGRHRLLAPKAAIKVSPLCLGTMNFGESGKAMLGECNQATAESILDCFYEHANQGGNFLDTANNYQYQESETWIGEWMKKRDNRDELVIATKYTANYKRGPAEPKLLSNFGGNGSKSLHLSIEASLRKLQTSYIDLLYVHWWDYTTPVEELMQSLNHLVVSGKVLYLGISDCPAWVVSKANEYARNHGLRQFSVYQGRWSAAYRDLERDIIPMCKAEGMGIAPWGPLGGGNFKTEEQRKGEATRKWAVVTEDEIKVSKALESIATRKSTAITSVALAYILHKAPYVFPIVGGRKVEHLKSNIEALSLELTSEDINEIEGAISFDLGFPHNLLWPQAVASPPQKVWLSNSSGVFDYVEEPKPIAPAQSVSP
ncbi:Norsolorinic acid reductase B [Paramyrothecium foliicola]|nr:Norsolorinic acid reductase B [Paramyrothecium foliicola]